MNHDKDFSLIRWTIPGICVVCTISYGCSTQPSKANLEQHLQANISDNLEIKSFDIKETENIGSKVQPYIQTRFHAKLLLREATFYDADRIESLPQKRQESISFIVPAYEKGEIIDLYGLATSFLVNEEWTTDFQYDTDPLANLGYPRSLYGGRTVLRNSSEEEEFILEVNQQIEEDQEFLKSLVGGSQEFSGIRIEDGIDEERPFIIRFKSYNQQSNEFVGELEFPTLKNAIVEIEGSLFLDGFSFKSTKVLKGNNLTAGTLYTVELLDRSQLSGRWEAEKVVLSENAAGAFSAVASTLGNPFSGVNQNGSIPIYGDIYIDLSSTSVAGGGADNW